MRNPPNDRYQSWLLIIQKVFNAPVPNASDVTKLMREEHSEIATQLRKYQDTVSSIQACLADSFWAYASKDTSRKLIGKNFISRFILQLQTIQDNIDYHWYNLLQLGLILDSLEIKGQPVKQFEKAPTKELELNDPKKVWYETHE